MEKYGRKRVENVHFDPCLLQNATAFRPHRIFYRCNREIWRLSHVWRVVYIIAWTRSSAVLRLSHSISLAPYLTTISRVSYSVTYTISRISIYLSTISCIYSLFYSTISCVLPRPLTPQPFILYVLRYIDTISCGPETIWVYLVCHGITRYYILCRPNIL